MKKREGKMSMERWIRVIAGTFVLVSLSLGHWVSPYWFLFTAFVGANLLQSSFTRWCLLERVLQRAGCAREPATTDTVQETAA